MGFSFGSFARGFAEAAVKDKLERETQTKQFINAAFEDSLEQAREVRKQRREERKKLEQLGQQLQSLGLSESQSVGLLSKGVDAVQSDITAINAAQMKATELGLEFDLNSVVGAVENNNLTLQEGIDRIMGTPQVKPVELPKVQEAKTGIGRAFYGTGDTQERQLQELQGAFGEDLGTLQATARGDFVRGEVEVPTINVGQLTFRDPMQDVRDDMERQQLEAAKYENDPEQRKLAERLTRATTRLREAQAVDALTQDATKGGLTMNSQLSQVKSQLSPLLSQLHGLEVSYNALSDSFDGSEEKAKEKADFQSDMSLIAGEVISMTRGGVQTDSQIADFIEDYGSNLDEEQLEQLTNRFKTGFFATPEGQQQAVIFAQQHIVPVVKPTANQGGGGGGGGTTYNAQSGATIGQTALSNVPSNANTASQRLAVRQAVQNVHPNVTTAELNALYQQLGI